MFSLRNGASLVDAGFLQEKKLCELWLFRLFQLVALVDSEVPYDFPFFFFFFSSSELPVILQRYVSKTLLALTTSQLN